MHIFLQLMHLLYKFMQLMHQLHIILSIIWLLKTIIICVTISIPLAINKRRQKAAYQKGVLAIDLANNKEANYRQNFVEYYQSDAAFAMFKQAKNLKDIDRVEGKKATVAALKKGLLLGLAGGALIGLISYIVWTTLAGAIVGFLLGFILGIITVKKPPEVYKPFYYNTIIKWLGAPLGVLELKILSNSARRKKPYYKSTYSKSAYPKSNYSGSAYSKSAYRKTGLGDLYDFDTMTEDRFFDFSVTYNCGDSNARIPVSTYGVALQKTEQKSDKNGRSSTNLHTVFRGFVYRMKLNRPLEFTVRIDSNENRLEQLAKATVQSIAGNKRLFVFNSQELDNMFDCMIYPVSANLGALNNTAVLDAGSSLVGSLVDAGLANAGGLGTAAKLLKVDAMAKKGTRRILSPSELQSLFKSAQDQENAHLKAKELITPQVEEFLLFLRQKYGPYTLIIDDHINIQFSANISADNKRNVEKQKRRWTGLSGLFCPTYRSDKDIMCHSLLRIYEAFMPAFLLGKYFDAAWRFDYQEYAENANLYGDDKALFDQLENLNSISGKELNDTVKDYYKKICETYKQNLGRKIK